MVVCKYLLIVRAHSKLGEKLSRKRFGNLKNSRNFAPVILKTIFLP